METFRSQEWAMGSIVGLLLLQGCGESLTVRRGHSNAGPKDTTAPIIVTVDKQAKGLSLAGESISFLGKVVDCASGTSVEGITEATRDLSLPIGDTCHFQLTSITYDGATFDLASIDQSSNWASGSKHLITDVAGMKQVELVIQQNLPLVLPPEGATVEIALVVSSASNGGAVSGSSQGGINVAALQLDELQLVFKEITSVDSSTGSGLFSFAFECTKPAAEGLCNGHSLASYMFGLSVDSNQDSIGYCRSKADTAGSFITAGAGSSEPNYSFTRDGVAVARLVGPSGGLYKKNSTQDNTKLQVHVLSPDSRCALVRFVVQK